MSYSNSIAKETTVQLRVSSKQKEILNQAAKERQRTLSNFILENAYQAALQVLTDRVHFSLPPEQWDNFCQALDQPARSIPALETLFSEPGLLEE